MAQLGIYRMEEDDLDEVMEIERESFTLPWTRWMFERELEAQDRSYFLVVKTNSIGPALTKVKVVGYIGFWIIMNEAHIVTIAVRKDFRRRGIGTILMASALILANQLGAERATLEVRVTNIPAQNMYEKFGFEIISIRKGFYSDTGEDAYVMWIKDLKAKVGMIRALGRNAQQKIMDEQKWD